MLDDLLNSILIYIILGAILIGVIYSAVVGAKSKVMAESLAGVDAYAQPPLLPGKFPWTIRSIDTQVVSKHWPDVSRDAIKVQVMMIKDLGANYVAVGTPYDKVDELKMWAEEAHAQGLNVWFRSHWASWEGDEGLPATMQPNEYLESTKQFILANPELFKSGDSFTVAVEAEQVGVGLGKRFLTWDDYRNFLLAEIIVANEAFKEIGFEREIHTNWLSVNGWVVENQFTEELVKHLGLIVVDHFTGQTQTIGQIEDPNEVVEKTMRDIASYYRRWKVPILIGEWGYQIYQKVPEEVQAEVVGKMLSELRNSTYIVGMNYWTHMGNTASLIGDEYGANLKYRKAADIIKMYYDPQSLIITPDSKKEE